MRKYFERASSTERRFVSFTFLVLFLVVNWIFVWPLFSDWTKYQVRREKALRLQKTFEDTIAQSEKLKPKVKDLEGEGMAVPAEDQAVKFVTTIQSQAAASGITPNRNVPGQSRTNQFFVERVQSLSLTAPENQLVDFLYKLGTGESLVRVRGLTLHPDPPRHQLIADLTLVASFQKKPTARGATPAAGSSPAPTSTPPPATKPAAPPVTQSKTNPPSKSDKPATAKPSSEKSAAEKPGPARPIGPGVPKPSTPTKKTP